MKWKKKEGISIRGKLTGTTTTTTIITTYYLQRSENIFWRIMLSAQSLYLGQGYGQMAS